MLCYLSTEEYERENETFEEYLEKLKDGIKEYVYAGLPDSLKDNGYVDSRLRDLTTELVMAVADTDEQIHRPILICGMNHKGIQWNKFFGIPHGKRLVIIDDDGDTYSFEEFDELAGETCELTAADEKILADIGASENEPEDDRWRMYVPRVKDAGCGNYPTIVY